MQSQQQPKLSVKFVVGVFFTLLGMLLTLDNLDLADADRFLPYWPLFLIAIGLMKLQDRDSRIPAIFAIAAGALLLLFTTDWVRFSIFDLWPVALILAGLAILARAFGFRAARARSRIRFDDLCHPRRAQRKGHVAQLSRRTHHRLHGRM